MNQNKQNKQKTHILSVVGEYEELGLEIPPQSVIHVTQ